MHRPINSAPTDDREVSQMEEKSAFAPACSLRFQCRGDLWLTAFASVVYLAVDSSDFTQPDVPLVVFHVEDVSTGQLKVIGDIASPPRF